MTRKPDPGALTKATYTVRADQDKWLREIAVKEHTDMSKSVRLALDVLRWMYERDGRLPKKEEFE